MTIIVAASCSSIASTRHFVDSFSAGQSTETGTMTAITLGENLQLDVGFTAKCWSYWISWTGLWNFSFPNTRAQQRILQHATEPNS